MFMYHPDMHRPSLNPIEQKLHLKHREKQTSRGHSRGVKANGPYIEVSGSWPRILRFTQTAIFYWHDENFWSLKFSAHTTWYKLLCFTGHFLMKLKSDWKIASPSWVGNIDFRSTCNANLKFACMVTQGQNYITGKKNYITKNEGKNTHTDTVRGITGTSLVSLLGPQKK